MIAFGYIPTPAVAVPPSHPAPVFIKNDEPQATKADEAAKWLLEYYEFLMKKGLKMKEQNNE